MATRAVTKFVGVSPQKVRQVIDQVRGMQAEQALALLRHMPQAAAQPVAKTIASALANADENEGLAREDMFIAKITADPAPLRKWRRFGARGRFKPIIRRSSHITVELEER
ncbi:MAG: 50S ribosomal protein L22 [Anaerolineae bacterium]|jgi:large subunit ribosomal protein L22|nr:50S ribosomal protein L22 [Anaerolineae bacterium]